MRPFAYTIFLILTFISHYCISQSNVPILSDTNLVQGIYMSFEEFKQNNPSIKLKATSIESSIGFSNEHTEYLIKLPGKNKINLSKAWGFSDGQSAFKREGYSLLKAGQIFNKIESFGRYCLYSNFKAGTGPKMSSNGMMTGGSSSDVIEIFIDINSGKEYKVTYGSVEKILAKDSELLEAYKKDKSNSLSHHIWLYSQKHPEEIK